MKPGTTLEVLEDYAVYTITPGHGYPRGQKVTSIIYMYEGDLVEYLGTTHVGKEGMKLYKFVHIPCVEDEPTGFENKFYIGDIYSFFKGIGYEIG